MSTTMTFLPGCTAPPTPTDQVEFRSPDLDTAIEAGLAITPLLAESRIEDAADATALITNEFHSELLLLMPAAPVVAPGEVIARLDAAGPDAYSRLRSIRRKLYRGDVPDSGPATHLAGDIEHRYAVIGWVHEETKQQDKGGGYDYDSDRHNLPVEALHFRVVSGRLSAAVLDLQEAEVLWRGNVIYKSEKYETSEEDFPAEVERARAGAAERLAGLIAER